jgi:hypothetical protein
MATSDVIWDWKWVLKISNVRKLHTKLFGHKLEIMTTNFKVQDFENLIHPDDLKSSKKT